MILNGHMKEESDNSSVVNYQNQHLLSFHERKFEVSNAGNKQHIDMSSNLQNVNNNNSDVSLPLDLCQVRI